MNTRFLSDIAENRLPKGQKPIFTTNVTRTHLFLRLVTDERRASRTMAVITGVAGLGKTIAAQLYCDELAPNAYTSLPPAIKVTVESRSTPRALAIAILEGLGEKIRGNRGNVYDITKEVVKAIKRNALRLLIIDEADRLNEDSFDVLRDIFDRTGCPIVLVGLPSIIEVIERYDKFQSRVRLRIPFVSLEESEILETVLPQLTAIPRWKYCAENPDDQQMGRDLWHRVDPSLRDLVSVLDAASQLAEIYGQPKVTPEVIDEALLVAGLSPGIDTSQQNSLNNQPPESSSRQGPAEKESEDRAEGRRRRRARRKTTD